MLCKYILVLVTLVSPTEHYVTPLTDADSVEDCYQKSILVDQDIKRDSNQEMLCIRTACEYRL